MRYDAIIVGARVAGSATALLLARRGMKVLLLDKASFPSDTISTHYIHAAGISCLNRWGLLERLIATDCPPIRRVAFDFGPFGFAGTPPPAEGGISDAYAPRRTVLDKLLVDAAVEVGCEVRQNTAVEELVADGGTVTGVRCGGFEEAADIVIGADGMHSLVARQVEPRRYNVHPILSCIYYGYWSNVPVSIAELIVRPRQTVITFPTHDGLTVGIVSSAISDFPRIRLDHENCYRAALPARFREGRMESRIFGTADLGNFYRQPYGPGWALVGDAGYHKDPLTAQGISDAFRDAELLAQALTGEEPRDQALAGYERQRNEQTMALYEFTCQRASYDPAPQSMVELLVALSENPADADQFVGLDAGTVRCEDFFDPVNIERILRRPRGGV